MSSTFRFKRSLKSSDSILLSFVHVKILSDEVSKAFVGMLKWFIAKQGEKILVGGATPNNAQELLLAQHSGIRPGSAQDYMGYWGPNLGQLYAKKVPKVLYIRFPEMGKLYST